MAKTALITGASSGLGAEFARQLAASGADVVLVARDLAALDEVAREVRDRYGVRAEVLPSDLTSEAGRDAVAARLVDPDRPIGILVNNAGFGLDLDFASNDIVDEERHLDLHVRATMRLSHAALGAMTARGSGRIINVASVAAFLPRGTYGAVKAWIVSFSRWANAAYAPVTVTAVCPGFTHTHFHERLGLPPGQEGVPGWMWLSADDVVREGLHDAARGKAVSIPSLRYKLLVAATRLVPAALAARLARTGR
ncbi:MAG: SDR family NAD(P)-dependent oxidoreductase [Candidatus Microbacterium phytovorans]|uniref:SDR family NAD(P)-dependent oxidoreductase n=1 Tax=Candidatus Microbacterium phytovorans TaxID=3121374 RepID=A0AAJ6B5N9_9MICO|nr:SDR family NAD(P)-dependent oxidoreductase [Microbacterium sp.]WEK14016.1 MAG: SDR family NAD(P)-dependent oxidoreductase [Microbacterium sp.]